MFELNGDDGKGFSILTMCESKDAALALAREKNLEAFEILDSEGYQVHFEFPQPVWA